MKKQTLLVPVDMEEMSLNAVHQSKNLARLTGSSITLLYVHQPSGHLLRFFDASDTEKFMQSVRNQLESLAEEARKETGLEINTLLKTGPIPRMIVDTARELDALFIIMGTYTIENTEDPEKAILGANTSRVIRLAECPVITLRSKYQHQGCRSILVPLDLTKETRQKVNKAIELAKLFNARVHVVAAFWSKPNPEIRKRLDFQVKQVLSVLRKENVKCQGTILESDEEHRTLVPIMLKYVQDNPDIDLIMIMTQQEVGIVEYFLGSHAQEMVRRAPVPVMSIVPRDLGERTIINW